MTRRIVQRRAARQDILDIVAYIAADNPNAAKPSTTPTSMPSKPWPHHPRSAGSTGRTTRSYAASGLWQIGRFRSYLIFYRPEGDAIEVIRVLHGRRDIQAILHDEGEG